MTFVDPSGVAGNDSGGSRKRTRQTMSIFKDIVTISAGGGDFEVAEAGVYLCRFKEIVVSQRPNPETGVMENRLRWVFETTDASDSEDRPFRFSKFTGAKFGNDKAELTKLIDQMAGKRLTNEEFQALDEDRLRRITWKVMVTADPGKDGKVYNNIVSVRSAASKHHTIDAPVRPAPKPKVEPVAEDLEDPFNLPG